MNSPNFSFQEIERLAASDPKNPEFQCQLLMSMRRLDMSVTVLRTETAEVCLRILDPEFFEIPWTQRASQLIRIRAEKKGIPLRFYSLQSAKYLLIPLNILHDEIPDFGNTFQFLRIEFLATNPEPLREPLYVNKLALNVIFEESNLNQADPFTGFSELEGLRVLEVFGVSRSRSGTQRPGWIDDRVFHQLCSSIVDRNQDLHTIILPNCSILNTEISTHWPLKFPKLRKIFINDIAHTAVIAILFETEVEEISIPLSKKDDNFHHLIPPAIVRKEHDDMLTYSIDPSFKRPRVNISSTSPSQDPDREAS